MLMKYLESNDKKSSKFKLTFCPPPMKKIFLLSIMKFVCKQILLLWVKLTHWLEILNRWLFRKAYINKYSFLVHVHVLNYVRFFLAMNNPWLGLRWMHYVKSSTNRLEKPYSDKIEIIIIRIHFTSLVISL